MFAAILGIAFIALALTDGFEAMVLPRRVTRRFRPARMYYRVAWRIWRTASGVIPAGKYRENTLSVFGPLSLLGLFVCWIVALIVGFALIEWGFQTLPPPSGHDFRQCVYHSGETFFTLGYGDVTPAYYGGKFLSVVEAGTGFGFMALVIGYLPVLYQAFSRRELTIALLDARAGSPPTAAELLRRSGDPNVCPEIDRFLAEWEVWTAELLESHLSFPVLSYYRSQHDNQSWLAALTMILDVSAIEIVTGNEARRRKAQLTFAMARHTCVDLCLVFRLPPVEPGRERLTAEEVESLTPSSCAQSDRINPDQAERLRELRDLYEPFIEALSVFFCLRVPRFIPDRQAPDNWQTSAWTKRAPGITELTAGKLPTDEHFG